MWFRKDTVPSDESALTAALLITFENLRAALPNPEKKTGTSRFSSGDAWEQLRIGFGNQCKVLLFFYCLFSILKPIKIHYLLKETSERYIAVEKIC